MIQENNKIQDNTQSLQMAVMHSAFTHLMLDIETMGNKSNSAIVSIGAVEFNIETGKTGKEFYRNVSLKSSIDLGLNIDADTVMWWMNQSDDARKSLTNEKAISISQALVDFREFCTKEYQIWGNSARFDLGLMQDAYNKANIDIPWDFRKERCVRTLVSFNPEIKKNLAFKGTAHNALSDCYHQIEYCRLTWSSLHCA
ncbi:MAG TPA: 3'-5' exonuclease [Flavobacterium sp.]|nr:3'-5' exonuclease [Flavobacterium sp.]